MDSIIYLIFLVNLLSFFFTLLFFAWSGLNTRTLLTFNDLINEIISNNRFLCIDKKSVYRTDLVHSKILKVSDLITDNNPRP